MMPLQVVNISNSEVNFLNEENDPMKQIELLREENKLLKAQLESTQEALDFMIMGGA